MQIQIMYDVPPQIPPADDRFTHFLKPFQHPHLAGLWTCNLFLVDDGRYVSSATELFVKQNESALTDSKQADKIHSCNLTDYQWFPSRQAVLDKMEKEQVDLYQDFLATSLLVRAYLNQDPQMNCSPWALQYLSLKRLENGNSCNELSCLDIMTDGSLELTTADGVQVLLDLIDVFDTFKPSSFISSASGSDEDFSVHSDAQTAVPLVDQPSCVLTQFSAIAIDYFENLRKLSYSKYSHLSLDDLEKNAIKTLSSFSQFQAAPQQLPSSIYDGEDDCVDELLALIRSAPPSFVQSLLNQAPWSKRDTKSYFYKYCLRPAQDPPSFYSIYADEMGKWKLSGMNSSTLRNKNIAAHTRGEALKNVKDNHPDIVLYWYITAFSKYAQEVDLGLDMTNRGKKQPNIDPFLLSSWLARWEAFANDPSATVPLCQDSPNASQEPPDQDLDNVPRLSLPPAKRRKLKVSFADKNDVYEFAVVEEGDMLNSLDDDMVVPQM